ncbi:MAG TPA: hypothetical protein VMF55_10840 [Solirubrobacterales bacterium]|nr:hypothetical protein [Solirubrobacterales bacterium]
MGEIVIGYDDSECDKAAPGRAADEAADLRGRPGPTSGRSIHRPDAAVPVVPRGVAA